MSRIDPTGEIGLPGMALGAVVEIGVQAAKNYMDGCDVFDLDNYDWADVVVSAGIGAIGPGWFSGAKGLYPKWVPFMGSSRGSGGALRNLSEQAERAQTTNRAQKIKQRMGQHKDQIIDDLKIQAALQVGKEVGRRINGDGRSCECRQ